MKHMEASKSTDVSMLDYRIVRSTVGEDRYCVIAYDHHNNPLFAELVDVDIYVAVIRVRAKEALREQRELQNRRNS